MNVTMSLRGVTRGEASRSQGFRIVSFLASDNQYIMSNYLVAFNVNRTYAKQQHKI
jgi:hypothetical protein